ncbi:MAG: hypothetical protein JNK44_01725 [Cyclobacteriaceae bacterium]|nr:hypothetical protein [Cyclobacteriaceae bacterium]
MIRLILLISLVSFKETFPQTYIFEGVITYKHQAFINDDQQTYSPIETEEVYHNERYLLRRVLSGRALVLTGNRDILLDAENFKRIQIDHDKHTYTELDTAQPDNFKQFSDIQLLKEDTILGHNCTVYKFRYLLKSEVATLYGVEMKMDTLTCEYYISSKLELSKPEAFAKLQGYRNTKLLDGRFKGIPLKIITTNSNGNKLIVEAVKIKQIKVDFMKIPDSYIKM